MPELPEVETVINILRPLIKGKTINHVEVFHDRLIQSDLPLFKTALIGKTFLDITRYGKFIFLHLSDDLVIITHLRMEGKFRYTTSSEPRIKHTSCLFDFTDGSHLAFDDTRKFGLMYLTNENDYKDVKMIAKLGVEANKVEEKDLATIIKKIHSNKVIKELLLDQSIMAGIGNIYADETLYASKIHPLTRGKDITDDKIVDITKNAKVILDKAIELGGSTIHSFHPSEGVDGRFQEVLMCYGREGDICPNCGTKFHKIFVGGRGTTFCPNCQIDHDLEKAIGVTGPIGSGKSTVLSYLKDKGYIVASADEIVHELYREIHIKKKISRIFGFEFDIDNKALTEKARQIMIANPSTKKMVEDYIYPQVEQKIELLVRQNPKVAIEVPLLFKAHYEYFFKKILVVQVSESSQLRNLNNRNENIASGKKLNADFHYDKDNKKIVLIDNNGDLNHLHKQIDEALKIEE